MDDTIHEAVVTCPACTVRATVSMPENACLHFWECPACHALVRSKAGDCCIFCSYGSVPCPPVQRERARARGAVPGGPAIRRTYLTDTDDL